MNDGDVLILGGEDVRAVLAGHELEVLAAVRAAYVAHADGMSSLPHSTFLRFPGDEANRIIALPAFLGDGFELAGVKWIASFPGNRARGLARASAVLILNSASTGRVEAILEGSLISAARTAASAAAAALALVAGEAPDRVGLIGTGPINLTIARYLQVAFPALARFLLYDLDPARAAQAAAELVRRTPAVEAEVAASAREVLGRCSLVSFGTTAVRPHIDELSICPPGATILHISLRDLAPEVILACDNVVDDADHVCRAQTSVHLAEQASGSRDFIRCSLAAILKGQEAPRRDGSSIVVFSPFGLGVLDLAVASLVRALAVAGGRGNVIHRFQPAGEIPGLPEAGEAQGGKLADSGKDGRE